MSNFRYAKVRYADVEYPSVEHAYQAAKTEDVKERKYFEKCTAREAKEHGPKVTLRGNWEEIKLNVMEHLVRQKFFRHQELRDLLLETASDEIIEGNTWGDCYWGECPIGEGENHLGKIIMKIRSEIQSLVEKK